MSYSPADLTNDIVSALLDAKLLPEELVELEQDFGSSELYQVAEITCEAIGLYGKTVGSEKKEGDTV